MTKSQNTKKDLCITSEQLTEQWKKGELINDKKYYITFFDSEPFEATFRAAETIFPFWNFEANGRQYRDENGYDCVKVLAPVPTFDEYQQLKAIKEKTYNYDYLSECYSKFIKENAQLKELLKECKEVIKNVDTYYGNYDSTNGYLVINKIDEVLK